MVSKVIICYGRFNPPHAGHEAMFRFAQAKAREEGAAFKIFTTHTHDDTNNPLTYDEKVDILTKMFPWSVERFSESTIFKVVKHLSSHGYDTAEIVVGGDQYKTFRDLAETNAKDFAIPVSVTNFAQRDKYPISSTEMRRFACEGRYQKFLDGSPKGLTAKQSLAVYHKISMKMNGFVRPPRESRPFFPGSSSFED